MTHYVKNTIALICPLPYTELFGTARRVPHIALGFSNNVVNTFTGINPGRRLSNGYTVSVGKIRFLVNALTW